MKYDGLSKAALELEELALNGIANIDGHVESPTGFFMWDDKVILVEDNQGFMSEEEFSSERLEELQAAYTKWVEADDDDQ